MTTPTDGSGKSRIQDSPLYDPNEDALIREAIQKRLAKISPEEGRKWRERLLAFLTQEEIVDRTPEGDGERG